MSVQKESRVMAGVAIRLLLGGCVAFVVAVCTAVPASSTEDPEAGDPRAQAVSGNAVTCAEAGPRGSIVPVTAAVGPDNGHVTITSVPDGTQLTGTVVKGGSAFNLYPGKALTLLHAPSVPSGHLAKVSRFFSCGVGAHNRPSLVVPPAPHGDQLAGADSQQDPAEQGATGGDGELAHTAPEFPVGPAIVLGLVLVGLGSLFLAPARRCSQPKERRRD